MLEILFATENDVEHGTSDRSQAPPGRRTGVMLSGLENRGATCYLNCLLQSLLYTPEFRDSLFSLSLPELGIEDVKEKKSEKARVIPIQLLYLFARLLLANKCVISTVDLIDSFGWKNEQEFEQHDVQELNHILLNAIESSLVGTAGSDIISHLYRGVIVNRICCDRCGAVSEQEEQFLDINVAVTNNHSLEKSLHSAFIDGEHLTGDNKYFCQNCGDLVEAKKSMKISCLPPILTFSLMRFSYDKVSLHRIKDTSQFIFPMELDMVQYLKQGAVKNDTKYELFVVIVHCGGSYGGHYHSYVKDIDCLGCFTHEDGCESSSENEQASVNVESVVCDKSTGNLSQPEEVLRAILSKQPNFNLSLQKLSCAVKNFTGESWNKAFRKEHGQICQFILRKNDLFDYCEQTETVGLKELIFQNSFSTGHCDSFVGTWFDFDDTLVKPVTVSDIQSQFSGDECAYILIYRRESLQRPAEARSNPWYNVPSFFVEVVSSENEELEIARKEFAERFNKITITVLFGHTYKLISGCLVATPDSLEPLELVVDLQMTYCELRETIIKASGFVSWYGFTLTVAKELVAGLHLYQSFDICKSTWSLHELGITDKMLLFVWDGKHLNGALFSLCGEKHEPVLLNIVYSMNSTDSIELVYAFPKSLDIKGLKLQFADLIGVSSATVALKWVKSSAFDDGIPIAVFDDRSTLGELNFCDGDELYGETVPNENLFHFESVNERMFRIRDCSQDCSNKEECFFPVGMDIVHVWELKERIAERFGHKSGSKSLRIRLMKNGFIMPPLYDDSTINDLNNNELLALENGIAPIMGQIVLSFRTMNDSVSHEVIVENSCTAQQCLNEMIKMAQLKGESWHLRPADWGGDPGDVVCEMNKSLQELGIQNGDIIFLEMANHHNSSSEICLTIWKCSTVDANSNEDAADLFIKCSPNDNHCVAYEFIEIGSLLVEETCTLLELKQYILTLPSLKEIALRDLARMRVRKMLDGHPTSILRYHESSIRQLNIQDGFHICVQLLNQCEDLQSNSVLVTVAQLSPDLTGFSMPKELLLNFTCVHTLQDLKETVATKLQLPVDCLLISKWLYKSSKWDILRKDESELYDGEMFTWDPSFHCCDVSLFVGNVILYDGDFLGVQICTVSNDCGSVTCDMESLECCEDLLKRDTYEEQNMDNCIMVCEDHQTAVAGKQEKTKKYETGITIHVGNFK